MQIILDKKDEPFWITWLVSNLDNTVIFHNGKVFTNAVINFLAS